MMTPNTSADALLNPSGWDKMDDITPQNRAAKGKARESVSGDELTTLDIHGSPNRGRDEVVTAETVRYRVYKIRWFGLAQLVLLNIIVSWDVSLRFARCVVWSMGRGLLLIRMKKTG